MAVDKAGDKLMRYWLSSQIPSKITFCL